MCSILVAELRSCYDARPSQGVVESITCRQACGRNIEPLVG